MKDKKQEELKKIKKRVKESAKESQEGIDPGIKDTVVMLNAFGLRTVGSCEGHPGEALPFPWVDIEPEDRESEGQISDEDQKYNFKEEDLEMRRKLVELLSEFYQGRNVPYEIQLELFNIVPRSFRLQSIFGQSFQLLDEKEQEEKYKLAKREMDDFTEFLKKRYLDK